MKIFSFHHQTLHFKFFSGFIFDPAGHLKSFENASMFEKAPYKYIIETISAKMFNFYLNSELVRRVGSRQHGMFESLRPGLGAPHVGCADPEHLARSEVKPRQSLLLSMGVDPLI